MKIAVTGALGFIGKSVLDELSKCKNIEITAIVRPASNVTKNSTINWVSLDITNAPEDIFKTMGEPDVLIHLAWNNLQNYYSLSHFESELPIHYLFIKNSIQQGLKNVLVAGTCFEYGLQSGELSADMITKPITPYGFAKDCLRKQLEFLQNEFEFNLTWARLFYLYGEEQVSKSLYQQLKQAVEKNKKIFKMSGGEQLRDYLTVSQVAKQIVENALKLSNLGPINICSGTPISIRNLVEQWIKKNDWDIDLELAYYPYPEYEPMAFWGKYIMISSKK